MLRSAIFNLSFFVVTVAFVVIGSPLMLAPRSWAMAGLRAHAHTIVWLLRVIVGTRLEVRGRQHLPDGPALIAAKHQSAWDTIGLIPLMRDPAMIMKAELMHIPFYGWFSRKFGMIPVRRDNAATALRQLLRDAKSRADDGRDILIFPEGTRRPPGAEPDYKPGTLLLYNGLKLPCCPVALNSGVFWPRRQFMRYPGTIIVEFLEPIPPHLKRAEFEQRLVESIEGATARLVAEARDANEKNVN